MSNRKKITLIVSAFIFVIGMCTVAAKLYIHERWQSAAIHEMLNNENAVDSNAISQMEDEYLRYKSYSFDLNREQLFREAQPTGEMGDYQLCFFGNLDAFQGMQIGQGFSDSESWGWEVDIDNQTVSVMDSFYNAESDNHEILNASYQLSLKDYIAVTIEVTLEGEFVLEIGTNGGTYRSEALPWDGTNGSLFVTASDGTELTDCTLSYFCNGWEKDIWLYGDSYFSLTADDRWTSYLTEQDSNNILLNAYSGKNSEAAVSTLEQELQYGTSKMIIWCMGMNDGDEDGQVNESWLSSLQRVQALCAERGIELILATIPTCPYWNNDSKNAYVQQSGYEYIDFAAAVGAYDSIKWNDNMLEEAQKRIHPTVEGAKALYYKAVATVPKLLEK